jgi:hypothetical protein
MWYFIDQKWKKKQMDKWGICDLKKQNVNPKKQIAQKFERPIFNAINGERRKKTTKGAPWRDLVIMLYLKR